MSAEPEDGGGDGAFGAVVGPTLGVPGGEFAELLDPVGEAFDDVAVGVHGEVEAGWATAAGALGLAAGGLVAPVGAGDGDTPGPQRGPGDTDPTLTSGGGEVLNAARRPVHGPDQVGRVILGITTTPAPDILLLTVNGSTGLTLSHDGGPDTPISLTVGAGVRRVDIVVKLDKLPGGATSARQLLPKAEHAAAPAEPTVGAGHVGVLSSAS